ncbi:hypothetical protein N7533_012404 [Penicillium manginii]|uniref:uncharacterized protein n=1 Tax=Penicillium manginii TaxID=203109 RepID=UPI00254690A7|nr:uncharacterized protein N7533_012404 [Penicillium manginii]KAJ5739620.1 hypothetical protein N7533_012404 [Penicillium manginii]
MNQLEAKTAEMNLDESTLETGSQADTSAVLINPEMERSVKRKIDAIVLPLVSLISSFGSCVRSPKELMLLCFWMPADVPYSDLDKQSLSYAGVFGLIDDLQLHGTQFAWLGSIFYVGQLVAEFPAMYLMSRLPLARFVSCLIILWGGICMCLAAATTFSSFMGVRFALGLAEGAVSPAFVTLTSIWYKKSEHPLRIGLWISCNGLAQILGALMMYGIGHNHMAISNWKAMFMVCGAITIFLGILFFFMMPAGPESAWFLNSQERLIATQRLQAETERRRPNKFLYPTTERNGHGYSSIFELPVWCSHNTTFASNCGYSNFETMLYTSPAGAVQIIFVWVGIFLCYLWPDRRCAIIIGLTIVPLTGIILLFVLPLSSGWGMIAASWLASVISNIFSIPLSLYASNTRGNTKKAIINALFFVGYAVGAICGPLLWNAENAPRYRSGLILALISWIVFIPTVAVYWSLCAHENKVRSMVEIDFCQHVTGAPRKDLTDKEDLNFRYTL